MVSRVTEMIPKTLTQCLTAFSSQKITSASNASILSPQSHTLTSFHLLVFPRSSRRYLSMEFAEAAGILISVADP